MIVETKPLWSPWPQEQLIGLVHMTTTGVGGRAEELLRDRRGRRAGHPFREAASLEVRVGVSVVILHRLRCGYADDQGGETSHFFQRPSANFVTKKSDVIMQIT